MNNLKILYKNLDKHLLSKLRKLFKYVKTVVKKRYNEYYKKEPLILVDEKDMANLKKLTSKHEVKKDETKTRKKSSNRSKR